jgi:hypothetical protein
MVNRTDDDVGGISASLASKQNALASGVELTDETADRGENTKDPVEPPPARPGDGDITGDHRCCGRSRERCQGEPAVT